MFLKIPGYCTAALSPVNDHVIIRKTTNYILTHGQTVTYVCKHWYAAFASNGLRENTLTCLNGKLDDLGRCEGTKKIFNIVKTFKNNCSLILFTDTSLFHNEKEGSKYFFDFTDNIWITISNGNMLSKLGEVKNASIDTNNFEVTIKKNTISFWDSLKVKQTANTQNCALLFEKLTPGAGYTTKTIEIWFKPESITSFTQISVIEKADEFEIKLGRIGSSSKALLFVFKNNNQVEDGEIPMNELCYLVIVFESTKFTVYVNNKLFASDPTPAQEKTTDIRAVCCKQGNCGGNIIEFLSFKLTYRHLTHEEISSRYSETLGRKYYIFLNHFPIDCKNASYSGEYGIRMGDKNTVGQCDVTKDLHRAVYKVNLKANVCSNNECGVEVEYPYNENIR